MRAMVATPWPADDLQLADLAAALLLGRFYIAALLVHLG
jgi:hypothetical protein